MRILTVLTFYFFCFFLLCLHPSVNSQSKDSARGEIPAELTAIDPEIRALLNDEKISCKTLNPNETVEKIQKALQIADRRGLMRDRALVEAVLGSALAGEGKLEMSFLAYQKALQDWRNRLRR